MTNYQREYTVNDAIEHAGFGFFQIFLLFLTGITWMGMNFAVRTNNQADSMEIMIISFIIPILAKEWNLDEFTQTPLVNFIHNI
jgi:hypothetical protein